MSGNLKLASAGGGSVTVTTPSTASNLTLTLPSATGTVATIAGTETLTNKTLVASGSNTVEATSGPTSTQLAGIRNKIINGAMMIDQRNAGASVTPTADQTYTVDRWQMRLTQSSKFSVQQNAGSVTPPAGFTKYLGITSLSSYSVGASDLFSIEQAIEGLNCSDLAWGTASAATVTLSFWVRSSLTGTFGGSLLNSALNRSYPFSYSISSANTWTQISVTIAGDTSGTWLTTNGAGILVTFGLGVGSSSSGTAGSWAGAQYWSATGATSVVGTNGATWYVTGVQLEKGATATPFENRLYGTELALCQRYYWSGANGWAGVFNTASTARFSGSYPVEMRSAPTITAIAAPTALNPTVSESQTGSQTTGFSAPASGGSIGTTSASKIQFGGFSSGADGRPSVLTNSPLAFSSEL